MNAGKQSVKAGYLPHPNLLKKDQNKSKKEICQVSTVEIKDIKRWILSPLIP
jgi:hypothetical protein